METEEFIEKLEHAKNLIEVANEHEDGSKFEQSFLLKSIAQSLILLVEEKLSSLD